VIKKRDVKKILQKESESGEVAAHKERNLRKASSQKRKWKDRAA